jgi:hypothetical protein
MKQVLFTLCLLVSATIASLSQNTEILNSVSVDTGYVLVDDKCLNLK